MSLMYAAALTTWRDIFDFDGFSPVETIKFLLSIAIMFFNSTLYMVTNLNRSEK